MSCCCFGWGRDGKMESMHEEERIGGKKELEDNC